MAAIITQLNMIDNRANSMRDSCTTERAPINMSTVKIRILTLFVICNPLLSSTIMVRDAKKAVMLHAMSMKTPTLNAMEAINKALCDTITEKVLEK
ncbi:hypothetical protein Q3G72_022586 [Acer saccharum]|nr:hypothetical protein Q3G72_022586 [Acer saccharum]